MSNRGGPLIRHPAIFLVVLAVLAVAAAVGLPLLGKTCYSPGRIFAHFFYSPHLSDVAVMQCRLYRLERFPATLLAMTAGGGLALAGLALQALFRNPLCSPYTLGVASGAAFGATLAILFGAPTLAVWPLLGFSPVSWASLAGAVVATGLILLLGRVRNLHSDQILLAGIAVSFFFSSLILAIQYISDPGRAFRMIRWTMGGIDPLDLGQLAPLVGLTGVSAAILFYFSHEMNLFLTGEERAAAIGVDVRRLRGVLFFVSSLLVGGIVSVCGPIGFVGLMVPHLTRRLVGSDHRYLVPATLLVGAIFLGGCFTLARSVLYPDILPVGVITALLGGPFFLLLLLRR